MKHTFGLFLGLMFTMCSQIKTNETNIETHVPYYDGLVLFRSILNLWQDREFTTLSKSEQSSVLRGFRTLIEKHLAKINRIHNLV